MHEITEYLLNLMLSDALKDSGIISWASPVPSFGNVKTSRVATLGINPSDKEYLSNDGIELEGNNRRFHTLSSLEIQSWSNAGPSEIEKILSTCNEYFKNNPYNSWFRPLNKIVSGTSHSYYDEIFNATHLDLVPFATKSKWSTLNKSQQQILLESSADTLGRILNHSNIELLILNGHSVVERFI